MVLKQHRIRLAAAWLWCAAACAVPSYAQTPSIEYQVKASMLFNFMKFVEWPSGALNSTQIVLGVIGDDRFGKALDVINGETVMGRTLVVKRMAHFDEKDADECHILFVCASERDDTPRILAALKGRNILTVGEAPDFLDKGGIINFIVSADKLRFEVNRAAERNAQLVCSSKLLRLAASIRDEPVKTP